MKKKILFAKKRKKSFAFFNQHFGYNPPYMAIPDSQFWSEVRERDVNLREKLPEMLRGDVKIALTRCILKVVPKKDFFAARKIRRVKCAHGGTVSPAECMNKLAETNETRKVKLILCTNSDAVRNHVRNNGMKSLGVPIIHTRIDPVGGNFHLFLSEPSPCQLGLAKRRQKEILLPVKSEEDFLAHLKEQEEGEAKNPPEPKIFGGNKRRRKKKRKRRAKQPANTEPSGNAVRLTKRQRKKLKAKRRKQQASMRGCPETKSSTK